MKKLAKISILVSLLISCNVLNFGDREVTTDLKLESNEITNVNDIEATFTVKNETNKLKVYRFASGCQFAFKVTEDKKKVFYSEENQGCTLATSSFELSENENKNFSISNYFDVELEPGNYSIKTYLIGYENEVSATVDFVVN